MSVTDPVAAIQLATISGEDREDQNCAAREIEVKFHAGQIDFKIFAKAGLLSGQTWTLENIRSRYFDTADAALRGAGAALRIRSIGRRRLMGLKWPGVEGASFSRGEIEVPLTGRVPDLDAFGADIAAALRALIQGAVLEPRFEVIVRRRATRVERHGSWMELAFDHGHVRFVGGRIEIREIELELKAGEPAALFQEAAALSRAFSLRLAMLSKSEQGHLALTGRAPSAVKATVPALAPNDGLDVAFAAILASIVRQFVANWPCLERSDDPDAIHQMRVALRRLRVALGLFHREIACGRFKELSAEAKRMAAILGEARDWDVLIDHIRQGPLRHLGEGGDLDLLLAAAWQRRAAAYENARGLIASEAATCFVLDCQAFITARGWRKAIPAEELPAQIGTARDFAARHLRRLSKTALKRGRKIARLAPAERHQVRIALKKLRYGVQFFETAFGKANRKLRYAKTLTRLQDVLGRFNDMAVARRLLDELDDRANPAMARAAGLVLGWTGHAMIRADDDIAALWREFTQAPEFWR